jgi:hypothetical protein
MRKRFAVVIGVAALGVAVVAPAQAASVRVTESEANKALRTFGSSSEAVILPLSGTPSDGRHYCAEDWHTVVIAWVEGGDASFTKKDAAVILDAISLSFTLDGLPLASERTKIKSVPDPSQFGFINAYFFNQGRVLSPDELAVGQHQLSVSIIDSSGTPLLVDQITFFIDAAGTGACL